MIAAIRTGGFRRAAITVLVVLLPCAAWSLWDYVEARRLSAAVKEIQSRGEPIVSAAIPYTPFKLPPATNAGAYYDAAAMLIDRAGLSDVELDLTYGRGERPAAMERLRSWLAQHANAEALLEKATDVEFKGSRLQDHLRWDRMWTVSSLGRARVIERLDAQDGDGAAFALVRMLRVGRALPAEEQPFFVERALSHLSELLERQPSPALLERLQDSIRAFDRDSLIYDDAVSSRAIAIESLWSSSSDWYGRPTVRFGPNPLEPIAYFLARPWTAHRINAEVRWMNAAVERARGPWPERLKGEAVPTPQIPATRRRFLDSPAQTVAYLHQLRSAALGAMLAQLRAADSVIAIERYRRAHDGALPASIDLLVPQFVARVPIDPFSGSSVLLGKDEARYVAYSIAANFRDDRGAVAPAPSPARDPRRRLSEAPDIGFAVKLVR